MSKPTAVELLAENERLRELVKCKTPGTLTQSQSERMPPDVWYSEEELQRRVSLRDQEWRDLLKSRFRKPGFLSFFDRGWNDCLAHLLNIGPGKSK